MTRLFLFLSFYFYLNAYAQIDPHKLDSLRRSIDVSSKKTLKWQDSFSKKQDSIYHVQTSASGSVKRSVIPNKSVHDIVNTETKVHKQAYVLPGIGILLVITLVFIFLFRRKGQK